MKKWIYQLRQERDKEIQRQKHFVKVFPTLTEALWVQLCDTIQEDLQELRSAFSDLISGETQVNRQPSSLQVDHRDQFPQYLLCLSIHIAEQKLTMKKVTVSAPKANPQNEDCVFTLSFNKEEQGVRLLLDEQVVSPDEFSNLCLGPLVNLHPVEIAKIASDGLA